jgi:hypothetical protein
VAFAFNTVISPTTLSRGNFEPARGEVIHHLVEAFARRRLQITHELQSMKPGSLWRPLCATYVLSYAAAPEFLDSGAQTSSMRVRETLLRPWANGALWPVGTGGSHAAQDSPGCIAKT